MTEEGHTHAAAHGGHDVGGTSVDRNIVTFALGLLVCAILIVLVPDLTPTPAGLVSDRAHGRIETITPSTNQVAPRAT